ncbi:MAG TPA: aldehyde dehydrogenase family protein, partial [Planctomicrobium sp.]|nr:aldehyde dehydrogenase family protein [Planctomicrobium sp.]
NAGQTCVAPDYLLVPQGQSSTIAEHLTKAVRGMFPTVLHNPDYTAIINDSHLARLRGMIEEAREKGSVIVEIKSGEEVFDKSSNKLPPTLVLSPGLKTRLMTEEIFGPVLPIIEYNTVNDAIHFVNERERPLALYWFGKDKAIRDRVLKETISGGVTVNDCLWHLAQEEQPFGGVGASGMGAYHGEWGFRTFSKEKPVFHQSFFTGNWLLYPPYGRVFEALYKVLRKIV